MPGRPRKPGPPGAPEMQRRTLMGGVMAGRVATSPQSKPAEALGTDDARLLELCRVVHRLDAEDAEDGAGSWDAVLQLSALQARTATGLRAKAQLVLALMPLASGDAGPATSSPDETPCVHL